MMNSKDGKLILLISSFGIGGTEKIFQLLVERLNLTEIDFEIWIVNKLSENQRIKLSNITDHPIHEFKIRRTYASFFNLYSKIKKEKPKKIITFSYEITCILILIKFISFKKYILISRNNNTISRELTIGKSIIRKYFIRHLILFTYGLSDIIINQCHEMKEDLVDSLYINHSNIFTIYNPIKINKSYFEIKKKNNKNFFLCVGRLEIQKNFQVAIEAFSLFSMHVSHYQLIIVGEGSQKNNLQNYINSLGMSKKIHLVGSKDNLEEYYLNATALLMTSLYEGFPNVILEAISHGLPVISFDFKSGPKEIIENGLNGFLIESSVNALIFSMNLIIKKPLKRHSVINSLERLKLQNSLDEYLKIINIDS